MYMQRLNKLREEKEYSQQFVADKLNVNRSSYANWEVGNIIIPLNIADKLSLLYDVPISYVLGIGTIRLPEYKINPINYDILRANLNKYKNESKHSYTNIAKYIDTDKSTVYFKDSKLKLDVGAIAKGFVCNKIYQFITDNDLWQSAVISLGGNIITVGNKPDNSDFIIGIENPNSSEYLDKVIADDKTSVVTSGSYQRYYTVGGKKYCHIIDKNTLFPADYFTSVTVICNNSALADAYSTALFCMNLSDGLQFAKDNDIEVIWMDNSGKITKTSGVNSAK